MTAERIKSTLTAALSKSANAVDHRAVGHGDRAGLPSPHSRAAVDLAGGPVRFDQVHPSTCPRCYPCRNPYRDTCPASMTYVSPFSKRKLLDCEVDQAQ